MMTGETSTRANANPSKAFFISMLTRDIDLSDCVLDLLDNAVDGITESAKRAGIDLPAEKPFAGREVRLTFDKERFAITDHSGGIPIEIAEQYAFRFGRPDDAGSPKDGTIGFYGIGMKRAIFKMGNKIALSTSTGVESFDLDLNVETWKQDPQTKKTEDGIEIPDWSFELTNVVRAGTSVPPGTSINITELHPGVSRMFQNSVFLDNLFKTISRDYAFIISRGLEVYLNDKRISAIMPVLRVGDELSPYLHVEEKDGVRIELTVGLASPPPDDTSALGRRPDIETYGWYIVCNDRVVVTADKSGDTVWGHRPVPTWHPQFTGFMGIARFTSDEPWKLPWKTTKRDVEKSNEFYQHALPLMIRATKRVVDYTNARRAEAKRLKKVEKQTASVPVMRVVANAPAKLPLIFNDDLVVIEYVREGDDVRAAAEALGMVGVSPSEVGIKTFEYFYNREVAQ
jgi:hypothetical protein